MAKRKALARALGGLGEGIGNASQLLLRQQMQDRYDAKIAGRQQAAADRQWVEQLNQLVAEGKIDPAQAQTMARTRGIELPTTFLDAVRPTTRKRLGAALDKPIMEAKSPEEVPGDQDIASIATSLGAVNPNPAPAFATAGMEPPSGALAGFPAEVVDFSQRAATRRRALESKPTERVEKQDPISGVKSVDFISPYMGPVAVTPSSAQQGVLEGQKKIGQINTSGVAEAEQAGREATATTQSRLTTENAPENVTGSARREGAIAGARSNATFNNDLRLAQERAKIEVAQAVNKENAINLVESTRAAQQLRQFFDKLHALSLRINTGEGTLGRVGGLTRAGQAMIGNDPDVRQMQQLIAQNLRPLAILTGVREANVSEKETQQALEGIGIKAWTTHTEAVNALRNLDDLIDLAPLVAARANTYASIGDRISMVSELTKQRRASEARAIQLGGDTYIDPITLAPRKVIK